MDLSISLGAQRPDVKVRVPDYVPAGQEFSVQIAGVTYTAMWHKRLGVLVLRGDGPLETIARVRAVNVSREDGEVRVGAEVILDGRTQHVRAVSRLDLPGQIAKKRSAAAQGQVVRSQITGKVLAVLVKVGDKVESGQALLVVEAMKMENRVFAQASGTVHAVSVQAGDAVQTGKELLRIAP